jgi:DNA-binding transcriptional regulator YdaS (Cro superfamily)
VRPIDRALELFKTQTAMAEAIGATGPFVSQWMNGKRPVSPKYCLRIEKVTGGAVTRYELRPDIFGESA